MSPSRNLTYLKSANAAYIDEMLERYLQDPDSVDASWQYFFDGIELGSEATHANGAANGYANGHAAPAALDLLAEARVADLITAYREFGRASAEINPLEPAPSNNPYLELSRFGLTNADLQKTFQAGKLVGLGPARLTDMVDRLRAAYCGHLTAEFMHVMQPEERSWLLKTYEAPAPALDASTRAALLKRLTEGETFERFLHTRYVAQKRFSVEGGENVLTALDCLIETGAKQDVDQVVIGMAHRGRLNVLTHLFGKSPEFILTEFEGTYKVDLSHGEGDVKYHMGFSRDYVTRGGKPVHLSMTSNPSHLEFVNPVMEGVARAKLDRLGDALGTRVLPVQIHGDAAFAGQGVCYETLNFSQLKGYRTGGSVHVVINNQVGFTTSPQDARSTTYCTDVAKMLDAPIFHVNGDDPEAVWRAAALCFEYRAKFHKDCFIDLICYRKHGHNEGDEPTFTQPLLYKKIKAHASPREVYAERLAREGVVSAEQAQAWVDEVTARMTNAQQIARADAPHPEPSAFEGAWKGLKRPTHEDVLKTAKTSVDAKALLDIAERINHVPPGFHLHPKLARFFEARLKAVQEGKGLDWGNAEALAYGSLLVEGHPVRLSGQDAQRGTFTHRHSVLNDSETGETYVPLNHIREKQAPYEAYNSLLSETAVMGFEYGYSIAAPQTLTLWEAQFGDFANGAQVIIDQFLASGESKWLRSSGLVLLLPHGYEGQGAEHSSARLERFLQLSGRDNLIVCNFTTPAQFFHALRRQLKRDFRKPLVVMTPKSLLRHPQAISTLDELSKGAFQEVIDDPDLQAPARLPSIQRVLLCSGKVYYDLVNERAAKKLTDTAVVRIEQLYPWPEPRLAEVMARYAQAKTLVWVQDEPRNMGAWNYVFAQWAGGLGDFQSKAGGRPLRYVGRDIGAAPAVGSAKLHETQQKSLIANALSAV